MVLRTPQVSFVVEGDVLPESAHTVLVIGPSEWRVNFKDIDVWYIDFADIENKNQYGEIQRTDLKQCKKLEVVNLPKGNDVSEYSKFDTVFFWICERLHKGMAPLSNIEYNEWRMTLDILNLNKNRRDKLLEFINTHIYRRMEAGYESNYLTSKSLIITEFENNQNLIKQNVLRNKVSLINYAILYGDKQNTKLEKIIHQFYRSSPNSYWLLSIGIASYYANDFAMFDMVYNELSNKKWYIDNESIPTILPDNRNKRLCYSPLLIAWRYLVLKRMNYSYQVPNGIGRETKICKNINWTKISKNKLFDPILKKISYSLIENWKKLHEADDLGTQQIKLSPNAYKDTIYYLESIWIDLLKIIQHSKKKPLIRLTLWPHDKSSSLSIRYDVDRPVSKERIENVIKIQEKHIKTYCGSWFFFDEEFKSNSDIRMLLKDKCQEEGIHLKNVSEAVSSYGCTFHSAPNSEYWRGKYTLDALFDKEVDYLEFFSFQLLYPRPLFIRHGIIQKNSAWGLPIHFPLEGSTNDKDLTYFDQLKSEFKDILKQGGHAIIGSHPDLNQKLLVDLIKRETLNSVWFDTIGNVVKRCRLIMNIDNIRLVKSSRRNMIISSDDYIPDLQAIVWSPDGKKKKYAFILTKKTEKPLNYELRF